jgi:protoporphyrinogen oxidase
VLRGAITTADKAFGYNPEFLYPAAGGIDALPRALADGLPAGVVRTGCAVTSLDASARRVRLQDGESLDSDVVISSLPLTHLAGLTEDLPETLREAARALRHVSIRVVNLGVRGTPRHPGAQWVYFPSPEVPFHRIGLPAALTEAMAPAGHHSLVAEIAHRPGEGPEPEASRQAVLDALLERGFLEDEEQVVYSRVLDIPEAYVVFDRERRRVLPELFRWFLEHDVVPVGRYGTWDYLAMEDSLVHGREVARWIERRRS